MWFWKRLLSMCGATEGVVVADSFAREWIAGWNARDLAAILAHYADDVIFSSPKAQEIRNDPRVNLSYAQPDDQRYVSVSGRGELVRDPAKMKELWNPLFKAWLPDGRVDHDLALLHVNVYHAQC